MSWWRQCADVAGLFYKEEQHVILPEKPVFESSTNGINIAVVAENNKPNNFEALNSFQNAYSLHVYHQSHGYIADGNEERLVDETILFLAVLDDWVVTFVQCSPEQKKRREPSKTTRSQILSKFRTSCSYDCGAGLSARRVMGAGKATHFRGC